MRAPPALERYLQFRSSEAPHLSRQLSAQPGLRPLTITLSRQSGCGAHHVAACLANYLQARESRTAVPWTVFDRNLVETILEDHHLPPRLARFLPEDRIPLVTETLDDLFGVHPPAWTFLRLTAETILRLARHGNAILIGRAAHVITRSLPHVFHVRLTASLEKRTEHLQERRGIGRHEALAQIRREDRGRQRYLKSYFGADIDDPLSYHLVVNTDSVPYDRAARIIADAALDALSHR